VHDSSGLISVPEPCLGCSLSTRPSLPIPRFLMAGGRIVTCELVTSKSITSLATYRYHPAQFVQSRTGCTTAAAAAGAASRHRRTGPNLGVSVGMRIRRTRRNNALCIVAADRWTTARARREPWLAACSSYVVRVPTKQFSFSAVQATPSYSYYP
jgi:hypothetical protein